MESAAQHRTLLPGEKLNWYRIERILGRGGFGVVYFAHDTNLEHYVAIKEYVPGEIARRESDSRVLPLTEDYGDAYHHGLERFITEARNLVRFRHPNIVRVMSVFEENNTAYMVMEFEKGVDLREHFANVPGARSESSLKGLMKPIAEGLAEVHRHGFVHRDIKPSNILVRESGSPVLLDFGSARSAGANAATQNLTALVSAGYAPLEQYNAGEGKDGQQGPWTDIYALGGVLYHAISGSDPVDSTRRASAVFNGGRDPLLPATLVGKGNYDDAFLRAIDWAMSFRIADRPQTLSDWLPALLSGTRPASAMPLPPIGVAAADSPTMLSDRSHADGVVSREVTSGDASTSASGAVAAAQPTSGAVLGRRADDSFVAAPPVSGGRVRRVATGVATVGAVAGAMWFLSGDPRVVGMVEDWREPSVTIGTNGAETSSGGTSDTRLDEPVVRDVAEPSVDQARLAEEAEAARRAESEAAREAETARLADEARLADAAERAREAEAARAAETEARLAEARKVREEEAARAAEQARLAEAKQAEEARAAEQVRLAEAEKAREAEVARRAEEARLADAADRAREADAARVAEEQARLAERAETAEQARVAEESRLAEEARAAGQARRAAQRAARAANAQRLDQNIAAATAALDAGRLGAAEEALTEARRLDADDQRLAGLSARYDEAVLDARRPISDDDIGGVMKRFEALRAAIVDRDAEAMDALTEASPQNGLFRQLMGDFAELDVSLGDIRVRNADKAVAATLSIRAMVRDNGDRAVPSDAYREREIISVRRGDDWSPIGW